MRFLTCSICKQDRLYYRSDEIEDIAYGFIWHGRDQPTDCIECRPAYWEQRYGPRTSSMARAKTQTDHAGGSDDAFVDQADNHESLRGAHT